MEPSLRMMLLSLVVFTTSLISLEQDDPTILLGDPVADRVQAAPTSPAAVPPGAAPLPAAVRPAAPAADPAAVPAAHVRKHTHAPAAPATIPPGFTTPAPGSTCTLLVSPEAPTACTHGPDPAPPGVDVRRYVPTEELRERGRTYAETAARGSGSTDGSGQIVCDGDGVSGKRVEALYVVASDRTDRYSALTSSFVTWARNADAVFNRSARLSGGARHLRYVTRNCALKVSRVVVPPSADDSIGNTIAAVQAKGFNRTDRRYLMWVDANVYCGVGTIEIDDRADDRNANNGYTAAYSRVDNACWNYAEAHELMHNLGGVQPSSPHATRGAHCYDESDEMCYDDDGSGPIVMRKVCAATYEHTFDCGRDDYFSTKPAAGSWLAKHWNTANSDFLIDPLAPVDRTPPGVPTGLSASATESSVQLSWNPSTASDIQGYRIYRNGTRVASTTAPSWTNSGLEPGVSYRYQVSAVDRAGNASALSSALVAGAVDRTPPQPPRNLRSDQSDSAPKILWSASPDRDVEFYQVYRDGKPAGQVRVGVHSWQDTEFGMAVHHTYRVHAVDRAGNVSASSPELLLLDPDPLS